MANNGLLGSMSDPNTMALMGMAQGLLQAGGPSRMPISTGQALGAGFGGAVQGAGNAYNIQQNMIQNMMMKQKMDMLRQWMGGDQANQVSAPEVGAAATDYNSLATNPGGVAPQLNAPGYAQAQSSQPQTPQLPSGAESDPRVIGLMHKIQGANLLGIKDEGDQAMLNNLLTYYSAQNDPEVQAKLKGAEAQATMPFQMLTSLARYAGRPITLSPGQIAAPNPYVNLLQQYLPNTPSGERPVLPSFGRSAGGSPQPTPQPNLQPSPFTKPSPVISDSPYPPGVLAGANPGAIAKSKANAEVAVKSGNDIFNTAMGEASNIPLYKQSLNEIDNLLQSGYKFGPGTETVSRMKALMSNIPGVDWNSAQTSQDLMKKFANFIAISQLGGGGTQTGTNAQLDAIMSQLPHGEMTNDAMVKILPILHNMLDFRQARVNVARNAAANGDFSNVQQNVTKFNSTATDPALVSQAFKVYPTLQQLSNSGNKQALQAYVSGINKEYPGLLPMVKKLEPLGAFNAY